MSKTIEQLRAQASQIEEASRQGENTQVRVGGLFSDIVDFIAQIPVTETILGPLLKALNNSELINPGDGSILTFSMIKDGWAFSDAVTQLQIKLGQITSTVTSNYEEFNNVKDQLEEEITRTDERVRNYKTEYDASQLEYGSWKSQTDTNISQFAVAIDKNTGDIVSLSGRIDTAYDQLDVVTNNLGAADKALEKLFNLSGLDYDDPDESYTASWLYKNRQGIFGAAATFDEDGNIINGSTLQVTIHNIESSVQDAEGHITRVEQTAQGWYATIAAHTSQFTEMTAELGRIQLQVGTNKDNIETLDKALNGYTDEQGVHKGILDQLTEGMGGLQDDMADVISRIQVTERGLNVISSYFDADGKLISTAGLITEGDLAQLYAAYVVDGDILTKATVTTFIEKFVDSDDVEHMISVAQIDADNIRMHGERLEAWLDNSFTVNANHIEWVFTDQVTWYAKWDDIEKPVMKLDSFGNLQLYGNITTDTEIIDPRTGDTKMSAGKLLETLSTLLNGFKAHTINLVSTYTIDYSNGSIQTISSKPYSGHINVHLPILSNLRNTLKKGENEDFCCTLILSNQCRIGTYQDGDDVSVYGGNHPVNQSVYDGQLAPRIIQKNEQTYVDLKWTEVVLFSITYINRKFVANIIIQN